MRPMVAFAVAVKRARRLCSVAALALTSGLALAQQAPPVDFGDLIILYRDAYGVPILTPEGAENTGLCQQPIYFASDTCPTDCEITTTTPSTVLVDQETCAVDAGCASCTKEVDFGRINEARSSDEVFDSQLQDVVFNLATSDCVVSLDPAGRMVTGTLLTDTPSDPLLPEEYTTSDIDSPLQNLAIYRQLIQTGSIGVPLPQGASVLDTAARALGAASDKTGEVNADLVAYLNMIMGLTDPGTTTILDPKICIQVREEVQGAVQLVQKCFLDYGAYGYDRATNFGALPQPAYIPLAAPADGTFEYLAILDETVPSFTIGQDLISTVVFADAPGFLDGNIGGFAQATDDARAVIDYMHTWPVPVDFATPVPCTPTDLITYDVSLSPQSGLQVPRNYVSGTEREFVVTVSNAGDPATGNVVVTGVLASGGVVPGSPWTFDFAELQGSASYTQLFSVTVQGTDTIEWSATIYAPYDVDAANNSATATSSVRAGGGGGGGNRP